MRGNIDCCSGYVTCCASSRVGARIKAWHSFRLMSIFCRIATANVAVLPVPDWAWAITSWPGRTEQQCIFTQDQWITSSITLLIFILHQLSDCIKKAENVAICFLNVKALMSESVLHKKNYNPICIIMLTMSIICGISF